MATFKKKELSELVGGDIFSNGNDRNAVSNREIETGPVDKPFNDTSDYEKGVSTTTDRRDGKYRQNIPWFAVYSFGGPQRNINLNEKKTLVTKNSVEEKIEDLVKKSKDNDVTEKGYNPKIYKLIDSIKDGELSEKQLSDLKKAIEEKEKEENKTKTL
jgi:hypothetical protein